MNKLKAVIVEDEKLSKDILAILLEKFHPDIEVVGWATNLDETVEILKKEKPQILFLDILLEAAGESSLDFLHTSDFVFENPIIITTAFFDIEFYQKAFRNKHLVVDFLLKPINIAELQEAIAKAKRHLEKNTMAKQQLILDMGRNKVSLNFDDIIYCEVEKLNTKSSGRTIFVCVDGKQYISEKTMAFYENILLNQPDSDFFTTYDRIHNRNHVKKLTQNPNSLGGFATMINDAKLPIAINVFAAYKKWFRRENVLQH